MTQQDKEWLLNYLSMALSYGVIINTPNGDGYLNSINQTIFGNEYGININPTRRDYFNDEKNILKPYLRPLSSMTEEEDEKRIQLGIWRGPQTDGYAVTRISPDIPECYNSQAFQNALKFLLREHFDIFGLIPKGLAIEVTEENNPYK